MLPPPLRNAFVSPVSWGIALVPAALAVNYAGDPEVLVQGALASFALYLGVYALVVLAWRARRHHAPIVMPNATSPQAAAVAVKPAAVKPLINTSSNGQSATSGMVAARIANPSGANQPGTLADHGHKQAAPVLARRRM
jgi:hypothetical protein